MLTSVRVTILATSLWLAGCCSTNQQQNYDALNADFKSYVDADEKNMDSEKLFLEAIPENKRPVTWTLKYKALDGWKARVEKGKARVANSGESK